MDQSRIVANLQAMLARGQDNALLRYSLGNAFLALGEPAKAAAELRAAIAHDPVYSAAWKLLGKALAALGDVPAARSAYEDGIRVAEKKGDIQAAKEMRVFMKRLPAQE